MKYLIALCIGMMTCLTSSAAEWTSTEVKLGVAAATLHAIDWGQTRYIAKNPHRFSELNPLLGDHPSMGAVNRHFIVSGLVVAAAAHYLPQYRSDILKVYIAVQTINTVRNFHIGLRVSY